MASGIVYVGGRFGAIGGQPRRHLAAITLGEGLVEEWAPQVGHMSWLSAFGTQVTTLAVVEDTVHVGGAFYAVEGRGRSHLAAIGTDGELK